MRCVRRVNRDSCILSPMIHVFHAVPAVMEVSSKQHVLPCFQFPRDVSTIINAEMERPMRVMKHNLFQMLTTCMTRVIYHTN